MFNSNRIEIHDGKTPPSIFQSEEYRKIVDVITSHAIIKTVDLEEDFGVKTTCGACGVLPYGTDQDFHVAYQLLLAGIGDKVDVLRKSAQDAKDRGDIGKEGGVEAEDYLSARANIIENPKILWE